MSTGSGRQLEQRTEPRKHLAETLATLYTSEERRVLLRELEARPEDVIPAPGIPRMEAWVIVEYFDHRGRLDELVGRVEADRPHAFTQPAPSSGERASAPVPGAGPGAALFPGQPQTGVDLLILTALTEEGQVVRAVLDQLAKYAGKDNGVRYFNFEAGATRTCIVATACAHARGAVALGVFAAPLLEALRPLAATLVGIAAAVDPNEVTLGDVPFASHVIRYDDIAVQDQTLTFRSEGLQVDPRLRRAAGELRLSDASYERWQADCEKVIPSVIGYLGKFRDKQIVLPSSLRRPHFVVEIVGGGPFLLRDAYFRDALVKHSPIPSYQTIKISSPIHPKLVSAEMESHGFMSAALEHRVPATVIKGISDLGDGNKGALEAETGGFFRAYACSNAVVAALHLLREWYSSTPCAADGKGATSSANGKSSAVGGSEEARASLVATITPEPNAGPQPSMMAPINDDKEQAPAWLAFRAPEFTARRIHIPDIAVRVIRTTDLSGQPLGAADLATGLAERLSLLVIDGPQLSGKTWHLREVAALLAAQSRDAAEVRYVLVPFESVLEVLRGADRPDQTDGSGLRLLAALAHKTIQALADEILPPEALALLQHDPDAALIVKAVDDYRPILQYMRGQVANDPSRRHLDVLGDFLRRALDSVPAPWANDKPVLMLLELQDSRFFDPEAAGFSGLLDNLNQLVAQELARPIWHILRGKKTGNVRLLVTGRQMEGLSFGLGVPNPNHPVRPLSWFTLADCRTFLGDPRVREVIGEEAAEALVTRDAWALTCGHPWFFSRLVTCLAAVRTGQISLRIGDPAQLVNALAAGSGLWLFESPLDRPDTLLTDNAFPETPAAASVFLKRILAYAARTPTNVEWLRRLTLQLPESERTHVGFPREYSGRALPWQRLGLVEFDSDSTWIRYSNGIMQRHFNDRRLERYVQRQAALWKGHDWLPAREVAA